MEKNNGLTLIEGIKFLWQFARKYKMNFSLFYLGWLVETFLESIIPILLALMIDEVVYYRNTYFFVRISLIFVVSSAFACILYLVLYTIYHYLMSMYTFEIKSKIFKHAVNAKASYLSGAKMGDIMALMFRDAEECMHIIVKNIFHFINGLLRLIFYILFICLCSWKMGALIIISLPLTLIFVRYFGRQVREQSSQYRNAYGGYISWVFEMLKGLRDIRLMAAEKSSSIYFIRHFKDLISIQIKTSITSLKAHQSVEFVNLVINISMYILAGFLAYNGEITIGIFVAAMEYFNLSNNQLRFLSDNNMDIYNRLGNIKRIYDFFNVDTEDRWEKHNHISIKNGDIKLINVSFGYNKKQKVLHDINLHIRSGEHLAIVGLSGSGKTTIVNLLLGFYAVDDGTISIDDIEIRQCSLKSIRQQIGVVQQEILIFDGSIRMNLLLGNLHATDEDIMAACNDAAIGDMIRRLPNGLDTIIGKEGMELSGGQKQRLAIARIFLKNPKILIFDEATSSLDHESEKLVHQAWEKISQNKTSIIIAHRLSSIIHSDRVAVIHDGKIVSCDNHEQLIKQCPYYQRLFQEYYKNSEVDTVC